MNKLRPLALAGFLALAACGSGDETTKIGGTTLTSNEQDGTAKIVTEAGSVAVANGDAAQNTKMPAHAPQYPGSTIVSVMASEKDGVAKTTMLMETTDKVADVSAFYSKKFSDHGLTIKHGISTPEVLMLQGEAQDKTASIMSSVENGKTSLILTF